MVVDTSERRMSPVEQRHIEHDEADWRFDRWVRHHFPSLGHGQLQKLMRTGQFRLDGKRVQGNERVQPGHIIVRQRGTKIRPGNNVGMGRDYTLFALIHGSVKFEPISRDKKKVSVYPLAETAAPPVPASAS